MAKFEDRLDVSRMLLLRKYPWAWRTVTSVVKLVELPSGSLAVDRFHRMYFCRSWCDALTDDEFRGVLWHEYNHLMRHHADRADAIGIDRATHRDWNQAADREINGELRSQGITLPASGCFPEQIGLPPGLIAEDYYGTQQQQDEQQQDQDGEDEPQDGQGSGGSPQDGEDDQQDGEDHDDEMSCGSGSGGEPIDGELPEPSPDEQGALERAMREQARDILSSGGYSPDSPSATLRDAANLILGKSTVDWRSTFATVVRTAMEQRQDEAEDYTFRRRSRRADAVAPGIIPGSFRPIPRLVVVVDRSGSMDKDKLTAAMTETVAILDRLAIPEYVAVGWDDAWRSEVVVRTATDTALILDGPDGGGTNMMDGLRYALRLGAEVVVMLTDCECPWDATSPDPAVPTIIGAVGRGDEPPTWAVTVEVTTS